MDNLINVTVSTLPDYDDGVPDDPFSFDLGNNLDELFGLSYAAPEPTANYGSPTRCGKIIRKYNWRSNEPPERYIRRIYQELSAECAKAQTQVRFLNGGKLVPTRDGKSVAYEFEIGINDGHDFHQKFSLSVPIVRR